MTELSKGSDYCFIKGKYSPLTLIMFKFALRIAYVEGQQY